VDVKASMEEQLDEAKGGSQSSERVAKPGASGAPPQTPEFSAFRPGLALNQNADGRELRSRANPGCRIGARVALQRGPVLRPGGSSVSKKGKRGRLTAPIRSEISE